MPKVEKFSISLEPKLAEFVRERAEEVGLSVSAYIAERLTPEFRNRQLSHWLDAEGIPEPSELEHKRAELEFAKADLLGAQREAERIERELRALERKEMPGTKRNRRAPSPPKKPSRKRPAAA